MMWHFVFNIFRNGDKNQISVNISYYMMLINNVL